jgi:hypothetical protein
MTATLLEQIRGMEEGRVDYIPFAQVINGNSGDPTDSGIFILKAEADKVGFEPDARWTEYEHSFAGSKEKSLGYMSQNPRILIVRSGGLAMFWRENGKFDGYYKHELYNKNNHSLKTRYLIYFIGEDGSLLHEEPMQFTPKGVFGATFGEKLKAFREAFSKNILSGQKRIGEFWAFTVFDFSITPAEKGVGNNKKWCATVSNFLFPSEKNIAQVFVGNPQVKARIKEVYALNEGFKTYNEREVDPSDVVAPDTDFPYPTGQVQERKPSATAQAWREKLKATQKPAISEQEARASLGVADPVTDLEAVPF